MSLVILDFRLFGTSHVGPEVLCVLLWKLSSWWEITPKLAHSSLG